MLIFAERFAKLFAGLDRAHGCYVVPSGAKPNEKGKLHNPKWAWTVSEPVTLDTWKAHLSGTTGLGIVPIRDDATCVFGALDVDVYPLDLKALRSLVTRLGLPLVVVRTKSGGAHLYLFIDGGAPATLIRSKLLEWSVALGYPGIEVFPKQAKLASENDFGSWINIPYFGGEKTLRYGIKGDGTAMTIEEFLEAAQATSITKEELEVATPVDDGALGDLWEGAPPCLTTLVRKGFGDWSNNSLFNIAVYLRKRYGDGWENHLAEYNDQFLTPPCSPTEVTNVKKSVKKKSYSYMCKQEPICGVCNRTVCLKQDFGVGGASGDTGVTFGPMTKLETDPPTFIWSVNALRLELTVDDVMDQRRFHKIAIEKLNIWPNFIKSEDWGKLIRETLERIEVLAVPIDATKEGQFWEHLEAFCTSKVKGRAMDELILGRPWTENGRTMFRSSDLFKHLAQNRFVVTEKIVYAWMRKRGVTSGNTTIKGKSVNYWSILAFAEQTSPHDVPRRKTEEM